MTEQEKQVCEARKEVNKLIKKLYEKSLEEQQLIKELSEITLKTDLRMGQTTRQKFGSGKYDDCAISLALANRASQNIYGQVSIRGIE